MGYHERVVFDATVKALRAVGFGFKFRHADASEYVQSIMGAEDQNGTPRHTLVLDVPHDLTFAKLEALSRLLGTTDINIEGCEQGYYGDHESALIHVPMTPDMMREHTHSDEASTMILGEERSEARARRKRQQRSDVIRQAKRLGLTAEDLSGDGGDR